MEEGNMQPELLPAEFVGRMKETLHEEWGAFWRSYEQENYQALRLNPLKCRQAADVKNGLPYLGEPVPWEKNAFYYGKENRPGMHPFHEIGLYYIQEPSAMSAAALLAPQSGMRVLDLCAAPGGKTSQLAAFLRQKGLLVANEIHPERCRVLSQNIERMGITNAIVTNEDSGTLADHFPSYFHAILVDAPCSGEGMFRKNPQAVNEWSAAQVHSCAKRQQEILENAAKMLLSGGRLVYSTCTFSEEENERNIALFLSRHREFALADVDAPWYTKCGEKGMFRLWPHKLRGEGHFVAVLQKEGRLPADWQEEPPCKKGWKDSQKSELFLEFLDTILTEECSRWILEGQLVLFQDQLYRLPKGAPSLDGIRVQRAGLHLGVFKKNRFEPAHALALALRPEDVNCFFDMGVADIRARYFLNGASVSVEEGELAYWKDTDLRKLNSWCLVGIGGYSAGWGKFVSYCLKNHYPKGLRKECILA